MLSIYLCEDIKEHRLNIEKFIKNSILMEEYSMEIVLSTADPNEVLDSVKTETNRGIYFLDIDLKAEMSGLQLAEKIRKYDSRGYIVFVTTHSEMAHLTFQFKVEAIDFIIKEEFDVLDEKISNCLQKIQERELSDNKKEKKIFRYKQRGCMIQEDLDKIVSFELFSNAHRIIMSTDKRQVQFYSSLKEVEDKLDTRFFRCSDSVIVNKDKIIEIDRKNRLINMSNGDEFTASVRKLKVLF